jgi:hypothetical protein
MACRTASDDLDAGVLELGAQRFDVVSREDQARLVFAAIVEVNAKFRATCVELHEYHAVLVRQHRSWRARGGRPPRTSVRTGSESARGQ